MSYRAARYEKGRKLLEGTFGDANFTFITTIKGYLYPKVGGKVEKIEVLYDSNDNNDSKITKLVFNADDASERI